MLHRPATCAGVCRPFAAFGFEFFWPSLRAAKRGQVQRSVDRVSQRRHAFTAYMTVVNSSLPVAAATHPAIASPGDPLFAARKEGELQFINTFLRTERQRRLLC